MSAVEGAYHHLKRRHRRFVDEYLLGRTGKDAMLAIGFKGTRPEIAASKFLARPEVRAAVEERRAVLCEAVGLRQEVILSGILDIAENGENHNVKLSAWRELAEIIGLKKTAAVQQALGPGLMVVVQQNIAQGATVHGPAFGVIVNLPGPA